MNSKVRRNAIAGLLLSIGAFISMTTRCTNLLLVAYQGLSIDKSLIKKLYSWKSSKSLNKKKNEDNNVDDGDDLDDNQLKIKKSIASRRVYSYPYSHAYCVSILDYIYCFCCWFNCLCCRKRRKM